VLRWHWPPHGTPVGKKQNKTFNLPVQYQSVISKWFFIHLSVVNKFEPLGVEEPVLEGGHGQEANDLDGEDEEAEDGEGPEDVDDFTVRT